MFGNYFSKANNVQKLKSHYVNRVFPRFPAWWEQTEKRGKGWSQKPAFVLSASDGPLILAGILPSPLLPSASDPASLDCTLFLNDKVLGLD